VLSIICEWFCKLAVIIAAFNLWTLEEIDGGFYKYQLKTFVSIFKYFNCDCIMVYLAFKF
jgi:hypothetical protein